MNAEKEDLNNNIQ